jgi:hypothetical protein
MVCGYYLWSFLLINSGTAFTYQRFLFRSFHGYYHYYYHIHNPLRVVVYHITNGVSPTIALSTGQDSHDHQIPYFYSQLILIERYAGFKIRRYICSKC